MSSAELVLMKCCPAVGREVNVRVVYRIDYGKMCPVSVEPVAVECLEADTCETSKTGEGCLVYNDSLFAAFKTRNDDEEPR